MADPVPVYSFASPRQQLFSLPLDVIRSMLENPSSHKSLVKLYQTCKYFYSKRPILITDCFQVSNSAVHLVIPLRKNIDVSHLKVPVWVAKAIILFCVEDRRLPSLFRYSVKHVYLRDSRLHFDDFILLNPKTMVEISAFESHVYYADLSIVPIEKLLQYLPNIRKFEYFIDERCSLGSLMKLNEIKFNNKLEYLRLNILDIDSTFGMNLFCEFIMNNSNANTKIILYPCEESIEKLKVAPEKWDPKWKNDAHPKLKLFFEEIHHWEEETNE